MSPFGDVSSWIHFDNLSIGFDILSEIFDTLFTFSCSRGSSIHIVKACGEHADYALTFWPIVCARV